MAVSSKTKLLFLSIYHATPTTPLDQCSIDDITHRGRLMELTVGDTEPKTLIDHLHMPDGITISKANNLIIWTQMGNPNTNDGSIWSSNLDGSNPKAILPPGLAHTPKQIIVDDESQKLYFSDREGLRIHRVNIDGTDHEILIETGDWHDEAQRQDQTRWCVGMAISHKTGKFYWTQKGAPKSCQGRISSANLQMPEGGNASSRDDVELLIGDLPEPIDLEIAGDALYWTDRGEFPFGNTLNKKTITGTAPESEQVLGRKILVEGFAEAIGLSVDHVNDCVWVCDLAGRVWKCDQHKPALKQKVYESETSVFTGLTVLHE
jgi:hypothetical protein